MKIKMDLSDVLLFLDLIKKQNKNPSIEELKMMLYYLKNYDEVKEFRNKLDEHKFKPPFKFYNGSLIHFIEDYEDCVNLKNMVLHTTRGKRKYFILFIQQILLAKTEARATSIIEEAKEHRIVLSDIWSTRYDSMSQIKMDQKAWRENINLYEYGKFFNDIYENYCNLRLEYFDSFPLKDLKENLINLESNENENLYVSHTIVYSRSVHIREFARRVSNGVCQLCDEDAPFQDKLGQAFLEVHHIHYLSKGGSDSIDNVVALCPNCHRRIHQLELESDVKKISDRAMSNMNIQ